MEGGEDAKGGAPRPVLPRRVRRRGHPLHVRRGAQRQEPHRHGAPLTGPRRGQPLLDGGGRARVCNAAAQVGLGVSGRNHYMTEKDTSQFSASAVPDRQVKTEFKVFIFIS